MMIMLFPLLSSSQLPTSYEFSLRNDQQVSSNVYEFDIYLQNTGLISVFELDLFQVGILVNPAILNGGTITASIVPGSSDLNPAQQPSSGISFASNCIKLANPAIIPHGSGTIISNVYPGNRIARVRLTNTVSFGQDSPNLKFNFKTKPYNSALFAYNQTAPYLNSNITNSAFFTVSNLKNGILNSVLPIELTSFNGSFNGKSIDLKWITATETNNDYFTLEKSYDGLEWSFLAKVDGSGNSNSPMDYIYEDKNPSHINYYRLTQTDFNGSSETFKPILVKCDNELKETDIKVFPNPFYDNLFVNITGLNCDELKIVIYDVKGNKILENFYKEINNNEVNAYYQLQNLENGIYFMEINALGYNKVIRIVKSCK